MNNYYKTLNLNGRNINKENLTDEQVKTAYERMKLQSDAMKARAKDAKEVEEVQKLEAKIQEAYHALETKEKREKYNEILEQASKEEIEQEKVVTIRKPVFNMPQRSVAKRISEINPDRLETKSEREYIRKIEETQKVAQRTQMKEPKQGLQFMPIGKAKNINRESTRRSGVGTETKRELQFMPVGKVKNVSRNTRKKGKFKDIDAGGGLRYVQLTSEKENAIEEGEER